MSDSISVRITLDSYDAVRPREKQTQVYVQIPEVARASWLLPAERFHGLIDRPWPEVLDVAQEHGERAWAIAAPATAARVAIAEWLRDDANHDEMQAAWELDQARRHPVARKLLEENERLRARVAELEPAPLLVYRASHDSIVFGLYTTMAAAREHCEALLRCEYPAHVAVVHDWIGDDSDPEEPWELVAEIAGADEQPTGYVVTPLMVAAAYDPEADA